MQPGSSSLSRSASPGGAGSFGLGKLHLAKVAINAVDASARLPEAAASALSAAGHASPVVEHVIVPVNSRLDPPPVSFPPWWSGPCDDNYYPGSFPLSSWDGLTACGPGPNRGGYDVPVEFFPGAWGELEWECVELSMRWLYLEYGVRPYPANGSGVVWDYSPADGGDLQKVVNDGTSVPRPGDVLSMGSAWSEGHTAVVTGTNLKGRYGTINILEQNMNGGNGTNTLAVVDNVVEPDYDMPVTGWLQAPLPMVAAHLAATDGSTGVDLVHDGGFNHGGPGAWHKAGRSRFVVVLDPKTPVKTASGPYEGFGFAVVRSRSQGGGIYQDISVPVSPGESFCADAEVVTAGARAGARGTLGLWLLGDSATESSEARFGPLRGANGWSPVSSCVTATRPHSEIRVQFYDTPGTPPLGIDAVDVHQSFVVNGGFDQGDTAGWHAAKHSWLGIESAGMLHTSPFAGNGFAVTNASASTAGIYQDVSLPIGAGDSLCADAEVVTAGTHPGARGRMALFLLGKSKTQVSFVDFGRLAAKSRWTAISTCVTAAGAHSGFRIEFYDAPTAPTLAVDSVDVHQSFVNDGGFNNQGNGGWHKTAGHTFFGIESSRRLHTSAYEGPSFAAVATSVRGGGIFQEASLPIRPGDSLCADAEVVTAASGPGARGELVLSLQAGSRSDSSAVSFGPLPAGGRWTPVSTCVTATRTYSGFRVVLYDSPDTPMLGVDGVDVR